MVECPLVGHSEVDLLGKLPARSAQDPRGHGLVARCRPLVEAEVADLVLVGGLVARRLADHEGRAVEMCELPEVVGAHHHEALRTAPVEPFGEVSEVGHDVGQIRGDSVGRGAVQQRVVGHARDGNQLGHVSAGPGAGVGPGRSRRRR